MPEDANAPKPRVLLADDEVALREALGQVLAEEGLEVTMTGDGAEAFDLLQKRDYDLLISDLRMPGLDGLSLLRKIREHDPNLSVILITAYGSVESAIEAMKLGAADYILKPLLHEDLLLKTRRVLQMRALSRENRRLRSEVDRHRRGRVTIGESQIIRDVMRLVDKIAQTRSSVLITGESGTGKELVARAVHDRGVTSGAPFVPVNCGGVPETLFESEMFGHRRGSFTGAIRDKIGFFEAADGGTLFLDEIGNLPLNSQMSLLRAIEEKSVTRVGDTRTIHFDLRIITATNVDLSELVAQRKFRDDLLFRLNVVQIDLPPLRKRKDDIPLLVNHFIAKYNAEMKRCCTGICDQALSLLMKHAFKGNIRELENVIERALIFAEDRDIEPRDLPFASTPDLSDPASATGPYRLEDVPESMDEAVKIFERRHMGAILAHYGYDKGRAAKALGISLPSLYRKIHELDLPMQAESPSEETA